MASSCWANTAVTVLKFSWAAGPKSAGHGGGNPAIPGLGRQKQGDHVEFNSVSDYREFKTSLGLQTGREEGLVMAQLAKLAAPARRPDLDPQDSHKGGDGNTSTDILWPHTNFIHTQF